MKALTDVLSLNSINNNTKSLTSSGSIVSFQVAASNDMGNQLANGGNVRIWFQYCGPLLNDKSLSWGSTISKLIHALAKQKSRLQAFKNLECVTREHSIKSISSSNVGVNSLIRQGSDVMLSIN